jgi:hypothetical protein
MWNTPPDFGTSSGTNEIRDMTIMVKWPQVAYVGGCFMISGDGDSGPRCQDDAHGNEHPPESEGRLT